MNRKVYILVVFLAISMGLKTNISLSIDGKRYAILVSWHNDFTLEINLLNETLIEYYGFPKQNIFLLSGQNTGIFHTKDNLHSVFDNLSKIIDKNDLLLIFLVSHGGGYFGSKAVAYKGWNEEQMFGYNDGGLLSSDGEEKDYNESDFSLGAFYNQGQFKHVAKLNEWYVYTEKIEFGENKGKYWLYRVKYVPNFQNVYFEQEGISNDTDIYIEKLIDYTVGDDDGIVDYPYWWDFDGDHHPAFNYDNNSFDENDWVAIDTFKDNVPTNNNLWYLNKEGAIDYHNSTIFYFNNSLSIDIDPSGEIDIDGTDIDGTDIDGTDIDGDGIIDNLDLNNNGDFQDYIDVDGMLWGSYDLLIDDELATYVNKIDSNMVIGIEACFDGEYLRDLSAPRRIIMTSTGEENLGTIGFFEKLAQAFGEKRYVSDLDNNGVTIVEAFNRAYENLPGQWVDFNTTLVKIGPFYDDNGDGVGHISPIPNNGDGEFGSTISLSGGVVPTDLNKDNAINIFDISIVAQAFMSRPGDLKWNPIADLNKDGIINIFDIAVIAKDYGKYT